MTVIKIADEVVYDGPGAAVPRQGDEVLHNGSSRRVESVTWEFGGGDRLTVMFHVGKVLYTF